MKNFSIFSITEFENWLNGNSFSRAIKLLQNHHTKIPSYGDFKGDNHVALLQQMEYSHTQVGFNEIRQHITTFPDGSLAICRSLDKIPAGIKGANQCGICIEHLGNFDEENDQMTDVHKKTIIKINALLCKKFNLQPSSDTIVYHHWYELNSGKRTNGIGFTKSCPGTGFFGGNTLEEAETNFIPLIKRSLIPSDNMASIQNSWIGEIITSRGLNVRTGPSLTAEKIKFLQSGIMIWLYEEKNDWYRIHPDLSHWVYKNGVKEVSTPMSNLHYLESEMA